MVRRCKDFGFGRSAVLNVMKLLTVKEVSEFLNVKESTIYSCVHTGSIPFYKLNSLLRFDMDEIIEWVKNSKPMYYDTTKPARKAQTHDIDSIIKKAIDGVKPN